MHPLLGLLCYDWQSRGTSDKYYLQTYLRLHEVLNYYILGLYKQNLKLWDIRRMKDQLDVTCYFISLIMRSTCFGH